MKRNRSKVPLLINGELAFTTDLDSPRMIKDIFGYYMLNKAGNPVMFNDLRTIGSVYTDRYGLLTNYDIPTN
jgi:hypothetical protein